MPRPDFQKHTLRLRSGDFAFIEDTCTGSELTATEVIRRIVSAYVDQTRKRLQSKSEEVSRDVQL